MRPAKSLKLALLPILATSQTSPHSRKEGKPASRLQMRANEPFWSEPFPLSSVTFPPGFPFANGDGSSVITNTQQPTVAQSSVIADPTTTLDSSVSTGSPTPASASSEKITPSSTSASSSSGTATPKRNFVPVIAGILGGVSAILVGAIAALYLFRRRRSRRKRTAATSFAARTEPYHLQAHIKKAESRPGMTSEKSNVGTQGMGRAFEVQVHRSSRDLSSGENDNGDDSMTIQELAGEVSRLRQLLQNQQTPTHLQPLHERTEMQELREEVQRLRHLVHVNSSSPLDLERGDSRTANRTSSPPAYEV